MKVRIHRARVFLYALVMRILLKLKSLISGVSRMRHFYLRNIFDTLRHTVIRDDASKAPTDNGQSTGAINHKEEEPVDWALDQYKYMRIFQWQERPATIFDTARACAEKERWGLLVMTLEVYEDIPPASERLWAHEDYELKLMALLPYHGRSPLVDSAIERLQAALNA